MGILNIEVAYATPNRQQIIKLQVHEGCSIEEAIQLSGMMKAFPEIDLRIQKVGIFSTQRPLSALVSEGDRVEIYRPLLMHPMQARRMRARGAR